ncbi:MAG: aminoglycoside phosphotransferase family protein [Frankia sp.]|nr:aminoglycoside phosphotransferase family protein [Frankia sp.]
MEGVPPLAELAGVAALVGAGEGPATVVSARHDRMIVRIGAVALKVHADDTDPAALAARLRAAADPSLAQVLLAPLPLPARGPDDATLAGLATRVGGRWVSAWPFADALGLADADHAPWERAGELLARLHRAPVPAGLGGVPANPRRRLARSVEAMSATGLSEARAVVLAAYRSLPGRVAASTVAPGRPVALIHGDWHMGQLVRVGATGWRLIDIDDLGVGDPAWDLARPAAWFAAGLLAPEDWAGLVAAYRSAGGPALPATGDPWPAVDLPARTFTVEYAARAVVTAGGGDARLALPGGADPAAGGDGLEGLDPVGRAFVECCRRIAAMAGGG